MRALKNHKLGNIVSTAVIAAGLSLAAGIGTVVATAVPAAAQATLSADQISTIQVSLRAALQAALTNEAKAAAIVQAIQTAVSLYGAGAAGAIASTVMTIAEEAGIAPSIIGTALAQAASALASANNLAAANAIAITVANEGNAGERGAFQVAATSLGFTNLASLAGQNPVVTGSTGNTGGQGGQGGSGIGQGGGGSGCLNPSCTAL